MASITLEVLAKLMDMPKFQAIFAKAFAPLAQENHSANTDISANAGNTTSTTKNFTTEQFKMLNMKVHIL